MEPSPNNVIKRKLPLLVKTLPETSTPPLTLIITVLVIFMSIITTGPVGITAAKVMLMGSLDAGKGWNVSGGVGVCGVWCVECVSGREMHRRRRRRTVVPVQ